MTSTSQGSHGALLRSRPSGLASHFSLFSLSPLSSLLRPASLSRQLVALQEWFDALSDGRRGPSAVRTDETYRAGLFATEDIAPGGEYLRVPAAATLTYAKALASPRVGAALARLAARRAAAVGEYDYVTPLLLFLIDERARGAASAWAPFIASLRQDELLASGFSLTQGRRIPMAVLRQLHDSTRTEWRLPGR